MRFAAVLLLGLSAESALAASPYDRLVLSDHPVLYLTLGSARGRADEPDLSGNGSTGRYFPAGSRPLKTRLPNSDVATVFDGETEYLEIPSTPALSVRRGGALTIEAWIRPDTLEFPNQESSGYVHWLGKGEGDEQEYACRMYSRTNSESPERPNRISGYVFNAQGGLGSGSYFQDPVVAGRWIHVAVIIDMHSRPTTIRIFKNGVLRKSTPLSQFMVTPHAGDAPVRLATRDLNSFFKGAMGKFALYGYALTSAQLSAHVSAMR